MSNLQENHPTVGAEEQFYDQEIAPVLRAVAALCESKGFSFMAAVEFAPGALGTTAWLTTPASLPMVMLNHCAKTGDNIDGYVLGLLGFCKENEIDYSKSIVMKLLEEHATPKRIALLHH